jgi:hypothetical protein
MRVVVSDSSVLIDLERGALLQVTFRLSHIFAVPDLLYRRELELYNGPQLREMGLQVHSLSADGVALASGYRLRQRRVSLPDAFALALAKFGGHLLLTGDANLRTLATEEQVECRGLLWLLDQIESATLLPPADLEAALSAIAAHPRCRLPEPDVMARVLRYRRSRQTG